MINPVIMVRVKGQLDPNGKQWFYFRFWWEHQKGSPSGPMRQIQLAQLPWTWISVQEDIGRVWGRFELRKKYIHGAQWNSQNATVSRYLNFMTFFISRNIWCITLGTTEKRCQKLFRRQTCEAFRGSDLTSFPVPPKTRVWYWVHVKICLYVF